MVPELQAAGLEVVGVSGDKIQVKTEVGYEWVDVIRAAGGTNPGWQWGSEGAGTPNPTKDPKEWAAMTGIGQAPMATAGNAGGAAPAGPRLPSCSASRSTAAKCSTSCANTSPTATA